MDRAGPSFPSSLPERGETEHGVITRRASLLRGAALMASAGAGLGTWAPAAHAGAQIEEPLADSVRVALRSAVAHGAPPVPVFTSTDGQLAYQRWLGSMSQRLSPRKPELHVRQEFLQTVWYESKRAALEVSLVMGLMQVESAFRKFAISTAGARGYMQVMPFWTRVIGDGDPSRLFQLQTNLRYGCVILRHYLDLERGNLFMALGCYNGSRGRPEYPNAVFAARRQWEFSVDGRPV